MDTCFAGEIDRDEAIIIDKIGGNTGMADGVEARASAVTKLRRKQGGLGLLSRTLFSDFSNRTGASVITASGGLEFVSALERPEGDNGVFTFAFLEGIRGAADHNHDGDVKVSEVLRYVSGRVPAMTAGRQRPTGRKMNRDADFILSSGNFNAEGFVSSLLKETTINGAEREYAARFSDSCDYFGTVKTQEEILEEERKCHEKWPIRKFENLEVHSASTRGSDWVTVNYQYNLLLQSDNGEKRQIPVSVQIKVQRHGQTGEWLISSIEPYRK